MTTDTSELLKLNWHDFCGHHWKKYTRKELKSILEEAKKENLKEIFIGVIESKILDIDLAERNEFYSLVLAYDS